MAGKRGFSSLQNVQTNCGIHPPWYQLASRDMKLIIHFHLVLELYLQKQYYLVILYLKAKCCSKEGQSFFACWI
jgi:hypothetical protein